MHSQPEPTRIASLFPDGVVTAECDPRATDGVLFPEEQVFLRRARPKRVMEFTAGRLCARRALRELGISDQPLLAGEDRAPIWPEGTIGSIAHTDDYCGVGVARLGELTALGLDVESSDPLDEDLWDTILTPPERRWLQTQPPAEQGSLAKIIFSAKECTYKCHHPIRKGWLDFHELEIILELTLGAFTARFLVDALPGFPKGTCLPGKLHLDDGRIFTGMSLPNQPGRGRA